MTKFMGEPDIFISLPDDATSSLTEPSMTMFWKNLEHRTIWITEDIDEATMGIIDYILYFNREDKDIPIEERKPIKLLINSPGGSLDVADSLISMIKLSKTPVYAYAMGMVASAASLIFLSAHKRFALPNVYLILHQGSCSGMSGDYSTVKAAMEDYEKAVEKMTQFYIDNTNFTEDEVRNNIKSDWYIYANEGIEKGIIHEMLTDIDEII